MADVTNDTVQVPGTPNVRALGARFGEQINVFDFIPTGNHHHILNYSSSQNNTQTRTGIQAAIDYGVNLGRPVCYVFPAGMYRINGPLEFGTHEHAYALACNNGTALLRPTAFGANQEFLRFNHATQAGEGRIQRAGSMWNIRIEGNNDDEDPVGLFFPFASAFQWRDVAFANIRNTAILMHTVDNSDWIGGELIHCGRQVLEKENLGQDAYAVTSGTTLHARTTGNNPIAGFFDDSDVGRSLYIAGAAQGGQEAYVTIDSVNSGGASCVLTQAPPSSSSWSNQRRLSWRPVKCWNTTVNGDRKRVILSGDVASHFKVGTYVYIRGAGVNHDGEPGSYHMAKVTVVGPSGTANRIDVHPSMPTAISSANPVQIYTAPPMVVAADASQRGALDGTHANTNDFNISHLRAAQNESMIAYLLVTRGMHFRVSKFHGRARESARYGRSMGHMAVDSSYVSLSDSTPIALGRADGSGLVVAVGRDTRLQIVGEQANSWTIGHECMVDWDVTGDFQRNALTIKVEDIGGGNFADLHEVVRVGPNAFRRQVNGAPVASYRFPNSGVIHPRGLPICGASFHSGTSETGNLPNNAVQIIRPPELVGFGIYEFVAQNASVYFRAAFRFSITGAQSATLLHALNPGNVHVDFINKTAANVVVNDGAAGRLSFLVTNDDMLVLVNRHGGNRVFSHLFLGSGGGDQ